MNKEGLSSSILFNLPSFFSKFFTIGHVRSLKVKKNIAGSFLLKGMSMIISFMLIPLTINYVDPSRYGIWLTLNSIIGWFSFFDLGLGNGLRNKFAEALAKNRKELARVYVSTTYAVLIAVIGIVYIVFIVVNLFLDWTRILNTSPELERELSKLVIIVFTFFSLQFVFNLIGRILTADQKPAIYDSINAIGSLFSLIIIYILTKTTSGSLLYLGTCLSATPVIVLLTANIVFFKKDYKEFLPSIKYVDLRCAKDLASLGIQFFFFK